MHPFLPLYILKNNSGHIKRNKYYTIREIYKFVHLLCIKLFLHKYPKFHKLKVTVYLQILFQEALVIEDRLLINLKSFRPILEHLRCIIQIECFTYLQHIKFPKYSLSAEQKTMYSTNILKYFKVYYTCTNVCNEGDGTL